jgi:hypothetical protein
LAPERELFSQLDGSPSGRAENFRILRSFYGELQNLKKLWNCLEDTFLLVISSFKLPFFGVFVGDNTADTSDSTVNKTTETAKTTKEKPVKSNIKSRELNFFRAAVIEGFLTLR